MRRAQQRDARVALRLVVVVVGLLVAADAGRKVALRKRGVVCAKDGGAQRLKSAGDAARRIGFNTATHRARRTS